MLKSFVITDSLHLNMEQTRYITNKISCNCTLPLGGWNWMKRNSVCSIQPPSSAILKSSHREQNARSLPLLIQGDWQSLTDPLSPIPQPIFHTLAVGAYCLFICLLEMNKHYQEPSVRSVSVLHAFPLVKCKMKMVQIFHMRAIWNFEPTTFIFFPFLKAGLAHCF